MHLAYGRNVNITSYPDRATVHGDVSYTPTYAGHTGVDGYAAYEPYGWRVPLYALSDGIVEAVASPEDPNSRYMSYQYSGRCVAVRAGDLVWRIGHLDECVVTPGQWIAKGSHVGYQGWTGKVDPPGVGGTHSHVSVYRDTAGQATPYLIDPTPYIDGTIAFPPSPKPEGTDMVTIPTTLYEYIDTPANVRDAPGGKLTGQTIATGEGITADALANQGGYTWARIADGWVAIAQGGVPWAVPVGNDLADEVAALKADVGRLTGELDAHKAYSAELTASEQSLKARLGQIRSIAG